MNAASREHGMKYNELINRMASDNIRLNRKVISEIAISEPDSFMALVETVKKMRGDGELMK